MTGGGFGMWDSQIYRAVDLTKLKNWKISFFGSSLYLLTGGCTVSLVQAGEIDNVIRQIDSEYHGATFYVCKASNGARVIDLGNLNWWPSRLKGPHQFINILHYASSLFLPTSFRAYPGAHHLAGEG